MTQFAAIRRALLGALCVWKFEYTTVDVHVIWPHKLFYPRFCLAALKKNQNSKDFTSAPAMSLEACVSS